MLAERANAGDSDAIRDLVRVGHEVIQFLLIAKLAHPELVRTVSKSEGLWPVLISRKSTWEKNVTAQLRGLELGTDLDVFHVRFESPRGPDENYPARQWAKAAVRNLEETRWRFVIYGQYRSEFQQMVYQGDADLASIPPWTEAACRLPLLSTQTVPTWGKVIRDMIREQVPDFHTQPEWENQRKTALHSGRNTMGEIRNAILDDIVSALKRIAPRIALPKSAP